MIIQHLFPPSILVWSVLNHIAEHRTLKWISFHKKIKTLSVCTAGEGGKVDKEGKYDFWDL